MNDFRGNPPEEIQRFIFSSIDSAEQLEILLYLQQGRERAYTVAELAREFRTSPASAAVRVDSLIALGLVSETAEGGSFRFTPPDARAEALVTELAGRYRVQRHRILQMIFSPMKKARDLADAFRLSQRKRGDEDG